MATVKEISNKLEALIPKSLSCDWDNDGLLICPDTGHTVSKVLIALDATDAVCKYAEEIGADLIVTHHPVIFSKLASLTSDGEKSAKAVKMIKSGISVMSYHTRFDAMRGGINDILANKLGLENIIVPDAGEFSMCRMGETYEMSAASFAEKIKSALSSPAVFYTDAGKLIKTVAVCGGDGKDFIYDAKNAGADALVTGRAGYNIMIDARDAGISVIEAGHYYTEVIFTEYFDKFFAENYPEIEVLHSPVGCEINCIR